MMTYIHRKKKSLPTTETVNLANFTILMVNDVYEMLAYVLLLIHNY